MDLLAPLLAKGEQRQGAQDALRAQPADSAAMRWPRSRRSGVTFLAGSPCASRPVGAYSVLQVNNADRWARWLLTVAGALAAA